MSKHHAVARMNTFNKSYPNAKNCYKSMQQAYHKSKNKRVFFPMQHTLGLDIQLAMTYEQTKNNPFSINAQSCLSTLNGLYVFGTWRNTLGIYRLDNEIIRDSKQLPNDTPTSIFYHLPEWAVYLDLSNADVGVHDTGGENLRKLKGVWIISDTVEWNNVEYDVINFVIDDDSQLWLPIPFVLDDNLTVEQSFEILKSLNDENSYNDEVFVRAMLPYLLWLCVEEPDIIFRGEPIERKKLEKQKFAINKKTGFFIPPEQPFIYEIGSRLGGEVRRYKEMIESGIERKPSKKRPHIRRGHWHGYWHGTGQNKQFKVKWQSALFING